MEHIEYLPLGSVVVLDGGIHKVMIVGRGLMTKMNDDTIFFDYGGVQYPEGLTGDQMAYFNHDGIAEVIFKGFSDEDDHRAVANIQKFSEENDVKRISPEDMRRLQEKL